MQSGMRILGAGANSKGAVAFVLGDPGHISTPATCRNVSVAGAKFSIDPSSVTVAGNAYAWPVYHLHTFLKAVSKPGPEGGVARMSDV